MPVELISNLDDPRLEPYRNLKATNRTRWSNQFIAEGSLVVERLLASHFEVQSVVISRRVEHQVLPTIHRDCPVYMLEHDVAEQLVGYVFHMGILACGLRQPSPPLQAFFPPDAKSALVAVCPNVNDPENVGAIIRLCAGFGLTGLILGRGCADPFSRRVLRVSMGMAFTLPIVEDCELDRDLRLLRDKYGFELCASVLDEHAEPLERFVAKDRTAILFGNEKHGLRQQWIDLCDRKVTIPMAVGADSLNVAVAAGIFFHVLRQSQASQTAGFHAT